LKIKFEYDSIGNIIEKNLFNSDGSFNNRYTFKYDLKGNELEFRWYNSDGSLKGKEEYIYEYDKKNNWIKKIKNKSNYIIERKIVYYGDKDENNYPEWDSPSFKGMIIHGIEL